MTTQAALFGTDPRPAGTGIKRVGNVDIDLTTRMLNGPAGKARLEPRVLNVLVTLADANGSVLSRDALLDICWGGQIVGDDAVNRTISAARKAAREIGADFQIETISKSGYRLAAAQDAGADAPSAAGTGRRALILGAAAIATTGAIAGLIFVNRPQRSPRVQVLVDRARQALRDDYPDSAEQGAGFLREAVATAPGDAEAWGLLALALRNVADYAPVDEIDKAVADCQQAARRALALQRNQPEAETAFALLPPVHGDWGNAEKRYRAVLARHPDQVELLGALSVLLISVGRIREGIGLNARAAEIEPLSPVYQYRRAYHHWFMDNIAEADRTIDRAAQLWPRHPAIWYARLLIRGLTGRAATALQMLGDKPAASRALAPAAIGQWRLAMQASVSREPSLSARAIEASVEAARKMPPASVNAILLLNLLKAIDPAFDVCDVYLLNRGRFAQVEGPARHFVNDQRWKKTMMLFSPAAAPMRADPRFATLCEGMGMADYWRLSGTGPDYARKAAAARSSAK